MAAAVGAGSLSLNLNTAVPSVPGFLESAQVTAQAASKPSVSKLAKSVKKAYGENYLPDYKLDKTEIKDRYGVDSSWYSSAYAQVPMMSAHVDQLAIFKAKNSSSKKKILKAVKDYQKILKKDTMQYPMNLLKIQGSKVYTNGNYVCFLMLGQVTDQVEKNGTDEEIIKAYKEQNLIGVSEIKKKLK